MKLKTYIVLAIVAFTIVAGWAWADSFGAMLAAIMIGCILLFYYPLYRLFFAIVGRLER